MEETPVQSTRIYDTHYCYVCFFDEAVVGRLTNPAEEVEIFFLRIRTSVQVLVMEEGRALIPVQITSPLWDTLQLYML